MTEGQGMQRGRCALCGRFTRRYIAYHMDGTPYVSHDYEPACAEHMEAWADWHLPID